MTTRQDNSKTEQTIVPVEEAVLQGNTTYKKSLLLEFLKNNQTFYDQVREIAENREIANNPKYNASFQSVLKNTKSRINKLQRQLMDLKEEENAPQEQQYPQEQ
jgi:hypothetical protein